MCTLMFAEVKMQYDDEVLRRLKLVELQILKDIDRVCREQGITYFLDSGTLLGAVRHQGFIPWDDDMDVVMLRADYERLIAGFDEWKSSDRFSLAWYRDGKSIYSFVKLVDTTTRVLENFVDKKTSTGVWVDIFPLEDLKPGDRRPYRKNALLSLVRGFIVADPSVGSSAFVKLVKRIVCPFARRLDALKYARAIDENARDANRGERSDVVADIVGTENKIVEFPRSLFDPVEMPFEDRVFLAPAGYERFLELQYGDWRAIPGDDDREIHTFEAYRL